MAISRRRPPQRHGLAVVDKPAGMTSHDVVATARRTLGERRIGHSGTLDPDATGVLLLGIGSVTRLLRYLTALGKTYTAEIVLGTETSTLDSSGTVTARHDMTAVTPAAVRAAATQLTGEIEQVPPMVSAVRVGGRRLHELAREGVEVDRPARPVTVHRFDIAETADPLVYRAEVVCSAGTYVRTLAADLGHLVGGGAHLRALRRTAVGSFTVAEAHALSDLVVLAPREAVRDYPHVTVDAETAAFVAHGRVLPPFADGAGPWAVVDTEGALLAVYERHGESVKPAVVLAG
jgi:tRNA pseudouridine55 synthase